MHKAFIGAVLGGTMALSACDPSDPVQAGVGGAVLGTITAAALSNSAAWIVAGGLAGAAAGLIVARNVDGRTCAYSRGDGTYYTARCPS